MKCPVCRSVDLLMSDRNGIEIDYCPTCRGVWLDRGELDKIIERATAGGHYAQSTPPSQPTHSGTGLFGGYQPPPQPPQHNPYPQDPHHSGHQQHHDPRYSGHQPHHHDPHYANQPHGYYKKKKREGFWDDLFDFD